MLNDIPRLGFLGTGWIGRHRMKCIAESGMARVAYLCDSSLESVAEAQQIAPQAEVARSFEDLLEAELDGIVIATPSAMHAEQSIRALEKGLAVFCQKPLGRNAAEARSIVHSAEVADRLLGVDLSYRHTEGMRRIREQIAEKSVGDIYAGELVFHNAYGPDKPWFYDPVLSGGGCVIDLGVHLIDLALWTLDFPEVVEVSSRLFVKGKPLEEHSAQVEDYASATIELASGASIHITCSWRLPIGQDASISAAFFGTRGGLAFRNVDGSFFDFVTERFSGTSRQKLCGPPDEWGGRTAVAWASALCHDAGFHPEIRHAIEVATVLDEIYSKGTSPYGPHSAESVVLQPSQ